MELVLQCEQSLPANCFVESLRIDSAGHQTKIIKHCDDGSVGYGIRAKMSATIKAYINNLKEESWEPLINKNGEEVANQDTCRTVLCIGDYEKAFTLIIQRIPVRRLFRMGISIELLQPIKTSGVTVKLFTGTTKGVKTVKTELRN